MGDSPRARAADDRPVLILTLIVIGMAAGWAAQVLVGHGRNSWGTDLVVGLAGSLATGLVVSLLAGDGLHLRLTGIVGSVAGAVLVLSIWELVASRRATTRRSKTRRAPQPAHRRHR
jgi:uncharacterized membrane protein YeaQ/YmgE (transglycosylase-associated protein family)